MARPRIPAGEASSIHVTPLAGGKYRARARVRDDAGELQQLRVVAETEDAARAELLRRAAQLGSSGYAGLTAADTIASACTAWLAQVRSRASTGAITFSTYESYESTARLILVPQCGGIALGSLTVGRCDRIIQAILEGRSLSAARRARSVLGQVLGYAVRDDAIPLNPTRRYPPMPNKHSGASRSSGISRRRRVAIRSMTVDAG